MRTVLDTLDIPDDPLPAEVRTRYGLQTQLAAWHGIHRPVEFADIEPARLRLKWDEAFVLQAVLAQRRRAEDALPATPRIPRRGGLLEAFDARLPFSLTKGQLTAGEEITTALCREHPMHRLLQGEVGSGKTLVAVRAMLQVIDDGGQAALLAPTEVLAQQHYRSITSSSARSAGPANSTARSTPPGWPCSPGRKGPRCAGRRWRRWPPGRPAS